MEGKILITLDSGKNEEEWQLTVGCTLPGKWILHWGVNYVNDVGRFACLHYWLLSVIIYMYNE